jgi:aryl-alcohol dehydrogenase-like predicted oxidoreductase
MALTKRTLGRTGLEVTDLSYGAMEVRGTRIWGGRAVTETQAETILNVVLDSGINFIDTANDYGRSEEFIGKYLSTRRSEYYLATKCGCTVVHKDENTDDTPHVWTRENLFRGLHESLERMKTDYIDVMQLHNPSVEQTEAGDLLDRLLILASPYRSLYSIRRLRCLPNPLLRFGTPPRRCHYPGRSGWGWNDYPRRRRAG